MHPFINNLSELSDNEVEEKIFLLQRRFFQTSNPELKDQIQLALDTYKEEIYSRRAIAAQRQKDQQSGENGLDSLINIS
jgi:thymidylate synthase